MTLLELIIGISIILSISLIAWPKQHIDIHQVDSFINQFSTDIRYVRSKNMLGNAKTYILYDKATTKMGYKIIDNGKIKKKTTLPEGYKISYSLPKIVFRSDGSLNGKGETITIFNNDGYKKEVSIVPFSGRVLVKEGKYED